MSSLLRAIAAVLLAPALALPGAGGRALGALPTAAPCRPNWAKVAAQSPGSAGTQLLSIAAVSAGDVWAGGLASGTMSTDPLVEHWDGFAWTVSEAVGTDGFVWGMDGAASDDVWAVGDFRGPDGAPAGIQRWNGVAWSLTPPPLPPRLGVAVFRAVSVVDQNDVWAVGFGGGRPLTEHWDGSTWSLVAAPGAVKRGSTYLFGVSARTASDVWAVGYSYDAVTRVQQPVIEHWDGAAWSVVPSPTFPLSESFLTGVAAVAADDVWAVGGSAPNAIIEHGDGAAWTVVRQLSGGQTLFEGIRAVSADNVWAVGTSTAGPLAEHWDGVAWNAVVTPIAAPAGVGLGSVDALPTGDLWAAGDQRAGGRASALVERVCPVKVTGGGFSPQSVTVGRGLGTVWELPVAEGGSHSITDPSGLGLFDSGAREPGASFVFTFVGAGAYAVVDAATGARGTIRVPVSAPASGSVGTLFTVRWASGPPPAGDVFDVQVLLPGGTTWIVWKEATTRVSAGYTPSSAGTYAFRARLRRPGSGASAFSPSVKVVVRT